MGAAYRSVGMFDKALSCLKLALENALSLPIENSKMRNDIAEIYVQLGDLYRSYYINRGEFLKAEDYYMKSLSVMDSQYTLHTNCETARLKWKYGQYLVLHKSDYNKAQRYIEDAITGSKKCSNSTFLLGRIQGTLGELYLRKGLIKEAQVELEESLKLIDQTVGKSAVYFYKILMSEVKLRLSDFHGGYEDACFVQENINNVEKNPWHNLRYLTSFYHAAFAKYKLEDYSKSLEHFDDFMKLIDDFCKSFLETEEYEKLVKQEVFKILEASDQDAKNTIKTYLHNSLIIFTAIYYPEHTFVKDYIAKNYEDETNESFWKMILSTVNYDLF